MIKTDETTRTTETTVTPGKHETRERSGVAEMLGADTPAVAGADTDIGMGAGVLVQAQNVGRTYKSGDAPIIALASATCVIRPGDRIALVGPSGSGKSTLLHLMGGLDTPTSGTLEWPALGASDTLRPSKVAFIFQMPSLLAPLTAVENVELPLLLGGASEEDARRAALDALRA